jgi:uncharacterized membrane protein
MDDLAIARALHVLAVVIWIGGVAMATTIVLPAVLRGDLGADPLGAFQAIERRFAWQARAAVIITGLTGLYMAARMDLWARFQSAQFWWMHAMVCLWLLFAFILFVAEPFGSASALRQIGDAGPGGCCCSALSGALGPAGAQPRHHLRRGRREPGLVAVLMDAIARVTRVDPHQGTLRRIDYATGRYLRCWIPCLTTGWRSCLMLHRTRHLFIRQQTAVINAIRAHLAEFGVVAPVGRRGVAELLDVVAASSEERVPEVARGCVAALGVQLRMLKAQILEFDRQIMAWHRSNETTKRLDEIPGGP